MIKPALEFQEVSFTYDNANQPILNNVNFQINEGEFVSIIGASGSGKSTLFRLVTGLEQPSDGTISINGNVANNRLGVVGYMPQQDLLMPWRTILENATLPLELKGIQKRHAAQKVMELLEPFGLKGMESRLPSELSGGMKQRVSFLRTFLTGADVFLLDEPFSALDAITRLTMQEWLLKQWSSLQKTILFITHDVEEALYLSDRIFVIKDTPLTELEEVKVPLTRPRVIRDMYREEIVILKEHLIEKLRSRQIL